MILRPAEDRDVDQLAEVHVLTWQRAYIGIVPQSHLDGLSVEKRRPGWVERLARGRGSTWVAEENDRILGFVTVGPSRNDGALHDTAEVGAIYVRPEHWHTGTGTRLWEKALKWAMEHEARRLTAWTYEQNRRALAFYEAMGCCPTGDRKADTIAGEEIPAILVKMPIPSTAPSDR